MELLKCHPKMAVTDFDRSNATLHISCSLWLSLSSDFFFACPREADLILLPIVQL